MAKSHDEHHVPQPSPDDYVRLPGLFRRWEIEQVVDSGADFLLERAGDAADGTSLFAVYRRENNSPLSTKEQ